MPDSLSDEITKTTAELTVLENQRNKYRAEMETLGLFSWPSMAVSHEKYPEKFLYLEDLDRRVEIVRQKLMSLQLAGINEVSKHLNQNVQTLNESTKSLQSTTSQALASSTNLERLTKVLIYITALIGVVAVLNIGVVMLQIYKDAGIATIAIAGAGMVVLALLLARNSSLNKNTQLSK